MNEDKVQYEEYPRIDLKVTAVKFGPNKVINKDLRIDVFDERPKIYVADKKNLYKDVYIDKSCANKKCKDGEVWRCIKTGFPGFYRWICITTSNKKLNIWRSIYGKSCRLPWGITFSLEPDMTVLYTKEAFAELMKTSWQNGTTKIAKDIAIQEDKNIIEELKQRALQVDDLKTPIDNEHD